MLLSLFQETLSQNSAFQSPVAKSLLKVAAPLLGVVVVWFVAKKRKLSPATDLGLVKPPVLLSVMWLAIYVAYVLGSNALMDWRGPWDFAPWKAQGILVSALRLLAVVIIGPLSEELVFRGLMQGGICKSLAPKGKISIVLSIFVPALIWACIHFSYTPPVIALIFGSGILLGLARHTTKSLWVPIAMHIAWNAYAVW